jgi:hypothetical protein
VKRQLSNYAGVDAYLDGAKRKISALELEAQRVDSLERKVGGGKRAKRVK